MAGVCVVNPICLVALMITVFPAPLVSGTYVLDQCYCYSDGYDSTLKTEIDAFVSPPTPPEYQYTGVKPKAGNVYEPCFCSDVTRFSAELTVTEASVVTEASNETLRPDALDKVTTSLNGLKSSMKSNSAVLEETLLSFSATYQSHTETEATFLIQALLRGRNETLDDIVQTSVASELSGNSLTGVGAIDNATMDFSAVKCSSNPAANLRNGDRDWIGGNLPSAQATYTCQDGYTMSSHNAQEVSTCSHIGLTWTALPDGLECTANIGACDDDPPATPNLAMSSWNGFSKMEGTVVTYKCIDGYSTEDNRNALSRCRSGTWTSISSSFICVHTGCLDPPPQVPNQGVLTWNNEKAVGTQVLYTCQEGYKSNTGVNPELVCANKTWIGYPDDWACIDEKIKLNLNPSPPPEEEDEMRLFYIVTIPSVAGLILMIIGCLCCTRVDSPLFNICSAKRNVNHGYTAA